MRVKSMEEISEFLQPIASEIGVEIVEVTFENRTRSLTVVIDCEGGVDLNLCEKFHRAIDGPLDELDPTFGEAYTLNCSSPGLDRPFKTERDFLRHIGEEVEVKLYATKYGKKYFEGVLKSFSGDIATVAVGDEELTFTVKEIAKMNLLIRVE